MKKSRLLLSLILTGAITLTGCSSKTENKEETKKRTKRRAKRKINC
jgi:lipoprotein